MLNTSIGWIIIVHNSLDIFLSFFNNFTSYHPSFKFISTPTAPIFPKNLCSRISSPVRDNCLFRFGNVSLSYCYRCKYIIQEYSFYVTVFQVTANPTKQWLTNKLWRSSFIKFISKGKGYLWLKFRKQKK